MFEKELARYGIEDRFVRVPGSTRVNEMFVTPQGCFKVNRSANFGSLSEIVDRASTDVSLHGGAEDWSVLADLLGFGSLEDGDVAILSGSLPAGWPADTYRVLVEKAKAAGARVVLDASGAALVEGVKAHPAVIKPNAEECEALVGFVPKTPDDFRRATDALKKVCDTPIISDGGAGCWFDGAFVSAPQVEVLDTTAAGDTLLAEWCWRTWGECGSTPRREVTPGTSAGAWAVAAGSAACTMPGGTPPPAELVDTLLSGGAHP